MSSVLSVVGLIIFSRTIKTWLPDRERDNEKNMSEIPQKETDSERDLGCHRRLVRRLERRELEGLAVILLEAHDDIEILINESNGVAGLHQNGDLAEWSELEIGGRFEEWLKSVGIARAVRESFSETNVKAWHP